MNFGNIPDRSLPKIEQTCERLAVMVYEVVRQKMAVDFKSITYSYEGHGNDLGQFTAAFIPTYPEGESDEKRWHGHRPTKVTFRIARYSTSQLTHPHQMDPRYNQLYLCAGLVTDELTGHIGRVHFSNVTPILIEVQYHDGWGGTTYWQGSSYADARVHNGSFEDLHEMQRANVAKWYERTI